MNREIKFRGKRIDNGEWVYWFALTDKQDTAFIVAGLSDLSNPFNECLIDPQTVGQYTGLKDKNGTEIWEGDIFKDDNHGFVRSVFRVPGGLVFEDNPVSFGYDHRAPVYPYSPIAERQNASWLSQCCEIIGSIHDNPELLK